MKLISLFFFLALSIKLFASDITIYVSPSGQGNGSFKSPTSLKQAIALLPSMKKSNPSGSITFILKDGLYELGSPILFTNENGGTEQLKIIFKAADNAKPVISGGRKILLKGTKILLADISSLLKQFNTIPDDIYINGARAVRARTPNNAMPRFLKTLEIKDTINLAKEYTTQYYEIPSYLCKDLSVLSQEQLKKTRFVSYHKWDNTIRSIDSVDVAKNAFYSTGKAWKPWNVIDTKSTFYLENYLNALDTCNEWILDGNTIKYISADPELKQLEIIVPVIDNLLILEGKKNNEVSNISFEGISFCYSNKTFNGFEPMQAAAYIDAAVMLDFANHITFENCQIQHTGQYGIWLRNTVRHCEINHCFINDLGAGGVRIGECSLPEDTNNFTSFNKVSNSIIHSGGYNYPSAVGVFIVHAANNVVAHNDIGNFRYTGVSVGWVWGYAYSPSFNNKIVYNRIHHIGWGVLSDMAGVYTLGISDGTEVSNNVVHDIYSYDYGGWGLYTDEGSTHIHMENNLVYNTKTGGFHQHYGRENLIRNNIIAFSEKYQAQYTRVENHKSFDFTHNILISDRGIFLQGPWAKGNVVLDSNCYWGMNNKACTFTLPYNKERGADSTLSDWQKSSGKDLHSIFEDPGFVNAKEYNFTFTDKSRVESIGFKPFNTDEAGVYGEKQWIELAKLPQEIIDSFNQSLARNMLP